MAADATRVSAGVRTTLVAIWLVATGVLVPAAWAEPQTPVTGPPADAPRQGRLRTFLLAKPAPPPGHLAPDERDLHAPDRVPSPTESLRATLGLGYVQDADWGMELGAIGSIAGIQVHADGLMSRGRDGLRLDRGMLLLSDPAAGWRIAAGDVFSPLRGGSRGLRVSRPASGGREPSVAIYGPRPFARDDAVVAAYRDQLRLGGQTILDAEVATDRSWMAATRWRLRPVEVEASYRDRPGRDATDLGVVLGVGLWRGVRLTGGWLRSDVAGERSDWRSMSARFPLGRWADVTVERTFSTTPHASSTVWAAMGGLTRGQARFFHRHQWGRTELSASDLDAVIAREQLQSMASYAPGARLSLTMQLATAWTDAGRVQHYQELQASLGLSRTTRMQIVTAVPGVRDLDRFRLRITQQLPGRFALLAEFGRVTAFQSLHPGQDRPRARVMLERTWRLATPARGGTVAGHVLDHAGHPVAGARVLLGPFATRTGPDGAYRFSPLPAGRYELSLDPGYVPASYAWDGQRRTLEIDGPDRAQADLRLTPLNAIHGRVTADRNGNGRVDQGEMIEGAVVRLGDRVTATDANGAYAFYNLWPGDYIVVLDIARLPAGLGPADHAARPVHLGDDGPVTGADFSARVVDKPIVWTGGGR